MTNDWSQRAVASFPAGSNGEFNLPHDLATVIRRGRGCRVETAEGRDMLDMSMGWGSQLVGHADERITTPVAERLASGANFATLTDASLELAEQLIGISPACDRLRFCASGTEATMYCLRLARAATGRSTVLRFEGAYHGAHDVGVTSMFPTQRLDFPEAEPSSDGLVAHREGGVLVAPFNDPETAVALIEQHRNELGAVIVEPLQRCLPPEQGFLQALRDATRRAGVPLVFDEVVTGFRLALGGAQERWGVVPDLVAYGKALGGGFPIGVFGGRADLMDIAREDRHGNATYAWTASTLGGNPISATAALATLSVLREDGVYPRLEQLGEHTRNAMRDTLHHLDLDAKVIGTGPLAQIAFTDNTPRDYRSSQHRDRSVARELMLELFRQGVFLNPMGTKLYLSLAHDERSIDEFQSKLHAALQATVLQAA
ncbi:MAG: aminotransferase class III-fold pyridoxal phosphate-dependent enzyme [Planctomycetota bacterium]